MTQSPTTKLLAIVHERQRIRLEEVLTYCLNSPGIRFSRLWMTSVVTR